MSYELHPEAVAENLSIIGRYEQELSGLGAAFYQEFKRAVALVVEEPELYQVRFAPDIRMKKLARFPHLIIYRQRTDGMIQVLAVAHPKRRPGYWQSRVSR